MVAPESSLDRVVGAWLAHLDDDRASGACAHPIPDELLERVATGDAPPGEADVVRRHVATCLPCLNAYAELAAVIAEALVEREPHGGPFIGRRREISALLAAFEEAAGGSTRLICLS